MKPLHLIAIACLAALVAASTSTLLGERVSASESTSDESAAVLERLSERLGQLARFNPRGVRRESLLLLAAPQPDARAVL